MTRRERTEDGRLTSSEMARGIMDLNARSRGEEKIVPVYEDLEGNFGIYVDGTFLGGYDRVDEDTLRLRNNFILLDVKEVLMDKMAEKMVGKTQISYSSVNGLRGAANHEKEIPSELEEICFELEE